MGTIVKLGILIDRLNIGGVEKSAIWEVLKLREMGVDATLLVLSSDSVVDHAYSDLVEKIPVEYLDQRLPKLFRFNFRFPIFAFFCFFHISYPFLLPFYFKKKEFTHVISHSSYTTFSALTLFLFRKIPYSIYFWDPIYFILNRVYKKKISTPFLVPLLFIAKFLDRLLTKNAQKVFLGSPEYINYLNYVVPKKIVVIPPGITLSNETLPEKEDYILTLTAWKEGKHPEYLFEILARNSSLKIKMVGPWLNTDLKEKFIKELNEKGYQKNVDILGYAKEEDLLPLYSKALVNLTLNLERGFGMPVLEAASYGTVSVVPKGSGVCSLLTDKINAFFFQEKDFDSIAEVLSFLKTNGGAALDMGHKAYNVVAHKYTWQAHASSILQAIKG